MLKGLMLKGLMLLAVLLGGCGEVYFYWQAGAGQLDIIQRRRPIVEVLADPRTDGETRRKLNLILEAQKFASARLALPGDGHYRFYADLERPQVTWLVVAAPPLELREHEFCYPLVGCLGYRGYFQREDADELAARLIADGLDVLVRPVSAYSTLGWFDDPVLNTFLEYSDAYLVGTVIHEQAHHRYFLKGDTTFNESFASFVEEEGLALYFGELSGLGPEMLERWRLAQVDRALFRSLVLQARANLMELYGSKAPDDQKRAEKARILADLVKEYRGRKNEFRVLDYDSWFGRPLNNAHLVGFGQYTSRVPAFRALFKRQSGSFQRFFEEVEALGKLPAGEREARLDQLEKELDSHHPPAGAAG